MASEELTSTSYLVLGLLAREGASTPYELKRHVAATIGHFWSFPHTLLYTEPVRLAALGLATESRETHGRRRRLFDITPRGRAALAAWLAEPSADPPQLRDVGLLQLFFADLGPAEARAEIAARRLSTHRARLAALQEDGALDRGLRGSGRGIRTAERWRGDTLRMGLLYEAAAVQFWSSVLDETGTVRRASSVPRTAAGAWTRARSSDDDRPLSGDGARSNTDPEGDQW